MKSESKKYAWELMNCQHHLKSKNLNLQYLVFIFLMKLMRFMRLDELGLCFDNPKYLSLSF